MKRKPKRKALTRSRPRKGAKVRLKHNPASRIKSPDFREENTLGQNIKRARMTKGITQLALAHAIGYTGDDAGAYISRVESGNQAPRIDTLQRIAEALGVAVCRLLRQTQDSSHLKNRNT